MSQERNAVSPEKNSETTGGSRTRFTKGQSGNPAGRPKGSPNKASVEMKTFARALLQRPTYRANFLKAWDARTLPPQLELVVYFYAFGRPPQAVELSGAFDHALYLASKTPDLDLVDGLAALMRVAEAAEQKGRLLARETPVHEAIGERPSDTTRTTRAAAAPPPTTDAPASRKPSWPCSDRSWSPKPLTPMATDGGQW